MGIYGKIEVVNFLFMQKERERRRKNLFFVFRAQIQRCWLYRTVQWDLDKI